MMPMKKTTKPGDNEDDASGAGRDVADAAEEGGRGEDDVSQLLRQRQEKRQNRKRKRKAEKDKLLGDEDEPEEVQEVE